MGFHRYHGYHLELLERGEAPRWALVVGGTLSGQWIHMPGGPFREWHVEAPVTILAEWVADLSLTGMCREVARRAAEVYDLGLADLECGSVCQALIFRGRAST